MSHHFVVRLDWTGNTGSGTSAYAAYERSHVLSADGKEPLACSSAPMFRGDATKYNPEDMLLYSVASCHMLWFLHCCADAGVVVTSYSDSPEGTLESDSNGIGRFTRIVLHPRVQITDESRRVELEALHHKAHQHCFIANSLSTPVIIE